MITVLRIGTTDYDHTPTGRPAARIFDMRWRGTVDIGDGASFTFSVKTCGPNAPFVPGVQVKLTTTDDDGSNPIVRFVGDLDDPQVNESEMGYVWAYACTDLKHRANWVTLAGLDGSGVAQFNLRPDDYLYLYSTSGNTVGQIVRAILEAPTNAAALNALGVGNYATMTPPTLPASTLADLALLTIVPAEPVQLQGQGILNTLEQFILHWHAQYAVWVEPDGTIRVKSIFGFTPQSLTVPVDATSGDDIDWPTYSISCKGCFTAITIRGLDIASAVLSVVDGTLAPAWTPTQQSDWTIDDFLQPKDGSDDGDLSGLTTTSATVTSDYATAHWVTNFWNTQRGGWVQFLDLAGVGIAIHEERLITSCTALTAGGSATITWDSSQPLAGTNYTRYHIRGLNSPLALVDRKFWVCEPGNMIADDPGPPDVPAHAAIGRETLVGSHLYPRFPKGAWLENLSSNQQIFYPAAYVRWSSNGAFPWFEVPIKVQVNPQEGSITLTEPAVSKFGDPAVLEGGYPSSFADGLWSDVRAVVPYNRGDLQARSPSSSFSGTAFTQYGIERELVLFFDALTWAGDVASMVGLAAEYLAVVQDAVVDGSCVHHEMPANFDPFVMGYALNFTFPSTTPIDGLDLPVRSTTVHWPEEGELHRVEFEFSNLRRPFEGDSLFIHPGVSGETFGTQGGIWIGGNVRGFGGSQDGDDWNSSMIQDGQMKSQSNQLSEATSSNQIAGELGYDPAGMTPEKAAAIGRGEITGVERAGNPLSEAMGNNPLAQQGNPIADALSGGGDDQGGGEAGGDYSQLGGVSAGRTNRSTRETQRLDAAKANRAAPEKLDLGSDITSAMLAKDSKLNPGEATGLPKPELPHRNQDESPFDTGYADNPGEGIGGVAKDDDPTLRGVD